MKKRLRKKLHLGEFAVQGVSLRATFVRHLEETEFDAFIDDFIEHAIEARALQFGGGGHPAKGWDGVIEPGQGSSAIQKEDLDWVRSWLQERSEIDSSEVSEAWDLWHGKDPFDSDHTPKI